jgi:hypothetical protein
MIDVKRFTAALSITLLLTLSSGYADSKTIPVEQHAKKSGVKVLKSSYDYLGSLKKYAFTATVTNEVEIDGEKIVGKRISKAKVKRPDQFRVDTKSDYIDRTVYLSEGLFTMMDNKEKYYAHVKTSTNIDKTLEYINKKLGIVLPLSTLFHSDMSKYIHPKKVQYFGTKMLGDVECDYIAFRQKNTVIHLWIENSSTPLIRSAVVMTNAADGKGTTKMFIQWDTDPDFSDDVFKFKAPKGASNVSIKPVK